MARGNKAKAIERLQKVLGEIPELQGLRRGSAKFRKWQRDSRVAIAHSFGPDSMQVREFDHICSSLELFASSTPKSEFQDSEFQAAYVEGLEAAKPLLESMIGEIEEYWEEDEPSSDTSETATGIPKDTGKIFVVHGQDKAVLEEVARFLEKLKLEPIILHEQPNEGRTIIEKFGDHADDVAFAVVLLTPDDEGRLMEEKHELKPRARQNVILELGFFLGKLGRQRVCPLVKGDVETPSDYDGVVYTKLDDAGAWKMQLFQELKAAGFDIDANQML